MNINEFERQKPKITMIKINHLIKMVQEEQVKTENLYRDRVKSLDNILGMLHDMKDSFKKGE
jgi:hypothetical protein